MPSQSQEGNIDAIRPSTIAQFVTYHAETKTDDGLRSINQRYLLTYSQITLDTFQISELGQYLISLFDQPVTCILAAKEKHQNGGDHAHIYLDIGTVVQIYGSRFFRLLSASPAHSAHHIYTSQSRRIRCERWRHLLQTWEDTQRNGQHLISAWRIPQTS